MEENTENVLDSTLPQNGDNSQVVLVNKSPKYNVTTTAATAAPAAIGLALSRTKRNSNSSRSSRGQSDTEQRAKKALYIDSAKSTDDSDGDSENRMVIQSDDSEKEATVTDDHDDVQSNQNGTAKIPTAKRKASNLDASRDGLSDDEDFCGFTVEEQCN